jgi:hypothetical protein
MAHPLVDQLRFTRSEWSRALRGTPAEDGLKRLEPMNSIGWIVGHLAWQEQRYWLSRPQGETPIPILNELVAYGAPASTPPLDEMLDAWRTITKAADPWLDKLTTADMEAFVPGSGFGPTRRTGDLVRRVTYHYWFHTGEILAIRQILGHKRLPEFVGDIDGMAPYRPE